MTEPLITLSNLSVRPRREPSVLLAVERLSLAAGSRTVIMGPSGAGKSMLLQALSGQLPGTLAMAGDRSTSAALGRIGYVPQRGTDALHPLIPVGTQVSLVSRADSAEVARAFRSVDLDPESLMDRRPAELSGGQTQRAAIALAFLGAPALVIADEPTSALDNETRDETLAIFRELSEQAGSALVVATHDPVVPRVLEADRVDVADGRIRGLSTWTPTAVTASAPVGTSTHPTPAGQPLPAKNAIPA